MRYDRVVILLLALASAAASADAQTPPRGDRPRPAMGQERRAQLEQQVHREFVARASERMGLDAAQQERLHRVLRAGSEARRELAMESRRLRAELMEAIRDEGAPVATYQALLERMAALRDREQALARREDAALAEFLDPRQQAVFLVLRMQMMDRVRGMRGAPSGPRPN